ncbi:hypothetical protein OG21DRAFT_446929 [Imleria badia]|nr:hypothetical protein OG21DRAFT_446929 [Imleria badia]
MEFYFNILYSSFPFPSSPAEKPAIPVSDMQAVLSNTAPQTAVAWFHLVHEHDPHHRYVVTEVTHYKPRSPWPDCQHEYIIMSVQRRPLPGEPLPEPAAAPILVKASRTITGRALPARLGLWGPSDDTVTVLDPANPPRDERLHTLTWTLNQAPHLERVSHFLYHVHHLAPKYYLLKTSCYTFACAIKESLHLRFNGITGVQQPHFLTRQSYWMHCIPAGITRAQLLARQVARIDQSYYDSSMYHYLPLNRFSQTSSEHRLSLTSNVRFIRFLVSGIAQGRGFGVLY